MRARLGLTALVAAAALLPAACGSDSQTGTTGTSGQTTTRTNAPGERPVTDAEALVLARLLNRNFKDGGARFTGSVPFPDGTQIGVTGEINWRGPGGRVVFRNPKATGPEATKEIYWTKRAVFEQAAPGARRFTRRAPNPGGSPFDFYIALLSRTSATTIDNIATIREQGATWVRADRIGDEPVDIFRYGGEGRSSYWVSRSGGLLRRLEVRIADLDERIATVDFTTRGPVRIALPAGSG